MKNMKFGSSIFKLSLELRVRWISSEVVKSDKGIFFGKSIFLIKYVVIRYKFRQNAVISFYHFAPEIGIQVLKLR